MKVLLLFSALILFANCAKQAVDAAKAPAPTPAVNSNQITVGNLTPIPAEESGAIDKAKQNEAEIQSEKLKNVPDKLKNTDFKNFTYQTNGYGTIRLKDGDFQTEEGKNPSQGNLTVELNDVYYSDLTGDGVKEAVVKLFAVGCGGSCDGGAELFFVYTIRQQNLSLLWQLESGSKADKCSLKSFTIKEKHISFETFGKCDIKDKRLVRNGELDMSLNKFSSKGASHYVFGFNGRQIVQKEKTFQDTPERSALNYQTEINIIE